MFSVCIFFSELCIWFCFFDSCAISSEKLHSFFPITPSVMKKLLMASSLNYHLELEQVLQLSEESLFYCYKKRTACELLFVLECGDFDYQQIALGCLIWWSQIHLFQYFGYALNSGAVVNCCLEVCPLSCLDISITWFWCRHHLDIRERMFCWSDLELLF